MGSVLFEAVAQSVRNPYELNSTEDLGSVCMEVNRTIRERIDREIEEETKREIDTSIDNTTNTNVTVDHTPNSCDISRNENLEHMEQTEEEERAEKMKNAERDRERPDTEAEPSSQRHGGQQLMWRYMVKEKKLQKTEEEPDTMNLKTSNRVTSTTTRNRITTIGSDVVALFPSLTAKETGEDCESQVLKSPLRIEGGNYKEMARYCTGNRKLAGNLDEIKYLLPWRRK